MKTENAQVVAEAKKNMIGDAFFKGEGAPGWQVWRCHTKVQGQDAYLDYHFKNEDIENIELPENYPWDKAECDVDVYGDEE